MRIDIAADVAPAVAAISSAGAAAASFGDLSVQLLGVPLPVLLAATAGAWIARAYTPSTNFFGALFATVGWTIAGCVLAPLFAWALGATLSVKVPANVEAGFSLAICLALPLLLPVIREELPGLLRAKIEQLKQKWTGKGG